MAETSYPLDKLFPIDLDDDYYNESEEEGQIPNAAMTPGHFLYIQNIFVLLLAYAVVWEWNNNYHVGKHAKISYVADKKITLS